MHILFHIQTICPHFSLNLNFVFNVVDNFIGGSGNQFYYLIGIFKIMISLIELNKKSVISCDSAIILSNKQNMK